MSPNVILVMRHAEKPTDDHDPHLSPPGKERAEKLATYIPDTFGKPGLCLRGRGLNARPLETIEPLAAALGLDPKTPFADAQYAELAQLLLSDAKYANKLIVVCWHHGEIPALMRALGAKAGESSVAGMTIRNEFTK